MRIPDPKANTTTEAYLAYKAGYLEESELKPVLYEPYLHFDAWLAYWAGLTTTYPMKKSKNIFNSPDNASGVYRSTYEKVDSNSFIITSTSTTQGTVYAQIDVSLSPNTSYTISYNSMVVSGVPPSVAGSLAVKVGSAAVETPKKGERTFVTDGSGNVKFYFYLGFAESGGQITVGDAVKIYDIQLEQGREATDFEEYSNAPEMLCDEEALVAYLSGVTDTYPEEIKDPYDVRIVGYLKYLVSARWGRPEYPVNNEEFYLSTMKPPVVPSGDPSSDIEMDDTAEAPFIDLKMYGDTYQQTYSGKNLYNLTSGPTTESGVTGIGTTEYFTLDGAVSGVGGRLIFNECTLPAGTYTATTYYDSGEIVNGGVNFCVYEKNTWTQVTPFTAMKFFSSEIGTSKTATFTLSEETSLWFSAYLNTGLSFGNLKGRFQLESGSTASSFEPYTGGIPAPNPDYPQDINVVAGEQTVEVHNKNLFHIENSSSSAYVWNGSSVTVNATSTSSYINISGVNPMGSTTFPAGTYTLSTNVATGDYTKVFRFRWGGENHDQAISKNSLSVTFTAPEEFSIRQIFVSSISTGTTINDTFGFQIEEGSIATTYKPYQSGTYVIDLTGKNLLNTPIIIGGWAANGSPIINGRRFKSQDKIAVLPQTTYTFSGIPKDSSKELNITIQTYDSDDTVISQLPSSNAFADVPFTFTTPENCTKITFSGRYSDNTNFGTVGEVTDAIQNVQIELGSEVTSYEEHYDYELCKIGDYQDYIYRNEDGDWYMHKTIYKYTFTGEEPWQLRNTTAEGTSTFSWVFDNVPDYYRSGATGAGAGKGICTYLTNHGAVSNSNQMYFNFSGFSFYYKSASPTLKSFYANTKDADLTAFKAGIAGQTLYYLLATATDTQIPNSELTSKLDALMEGGSYEGKTFIKVTATDPNLPGLLYVEAGKYD